VSIDKRTLRSGAVRYDVRLRAPDGRQYMRTFRTKREAERFQAGELVDRSRGSWVDPTAGKAKFSAWASEWLASMEHTWRPRTADKHRMALRAHWLPHFGDRELATITPRQVQAAVNGLASTLQPSSVRTYYGTLRSLFAAAVALEVLSRSPCRGVKLPAADADEKTVIAPAQLHALADAVGRDWRALIYLGGVAGLRFGEAIALRVVDVDFDKAELSVTRTVTETDGRLTIGKPKTSAGHRTLALPASLVEEIRQHVDRLGLVDGDELLFADSFGGPLRRSNFRRRVFDPATRSTRVEGLTFHGLRHSAATQWVADGIDPRTVQHRLGHADPRLVLRLYAHVSTQADRQAAATAESIYWSDDDGRNV